MTYLGESWFKDVRVLLKVVAAVAFCKRSQPPNCKNAIEKTLYMSRKNWVEYFLVAQVCQLVRPAVPARAAVAARPAMPAVWQVEF